MRLKNDHQCIIQAPSLISRPGPHLKNANGIWTAQFTAGSDWPSKTLKSERAVSLWLTKTQHELDTGEYVAPSDMKLAQWWDRWFDVYESMTVSNAKPVNPRNVLRVMRTITNHNVHDLRHIYSMRAARRGFNPQLLQTITGQKTLSVVLGIYTRHRSGSAR